MKHRIFSISLLLILSAFSVKRTASLTHEYMDIMKKMLSQMDTMQKTQDPDHDFASMMIVHHKASIEMNDVLMKKGSDKKLIAIAKKMKTEQEKDIREMNEFLSHHQPDTVNDSFNKQMKVAMDKMKKDSESMKISGDYDKDYVMLMIPHHQASIETAGLLEKHGTDKKLMKMVEKMKKNEEKELKELQDWMNKKK